MTTFLVNVAKYYEGLANQDKALQILQAELEKTHPELLSNDSEFMRIWRNPDDTSIGTTTITTTTEVVTVTAATTRSPVISTGVVTTTTTEVSAYHQVALEIPYLSQLNNECNPHGSCNVTSVAMCLAYLGHPSICPSGEQLEDELYRYCIKYGLSRHSPVDLAKLVRIYGYKDDFQEDAKWADVKQWLASGSPCIVHGWFSRSGHIIVITGYNEKGWIVNDPYGEWFEWGYDTTVSGKGLTYSYNIMRELCGTDGDLWIHYVSK